jgi:glycosyltransferase involved in cell wall biosynthesis
MKRLSRQNDIVWINYRGTRRPQATAADVGAILATLRKVAGGIRPIADRMVQLTPLVVPGAHHPWSQSVNRKLLAAQIRRAVGRVDHGRGRPVQLWTFAPDVGFLADRSAYERVVYYCVDEYSEFADVDGAAIAAAERRLIAQSDVVITTASALYESKRGLHPNTHLVRHGVDAAHFAQAVDETLPVPADVRHLPRPVLGFFGLIRQWIDCDLLAAVARRRPEYSLVLIGDDHQNHPGLRRLDNVHLLGRRDYAELPAYCKAFDVGLLPFVRNRMTRNVNPIKLREYLAAGLPVVSTALPEAERYAPDVCIADGVDAFLCACDDAVSHTVPGDRHRRSRRVSGETWEAVVERVCELVLAADRDAAHVPTAPCPGRRIHQPKAETRVPGSIEPFLADSP